jgi:hypothetical protein
MFLQPTRSECIVSYTFLLFAKRLLAVIRIAKTDKKKLSEYGLYPTGNLVLLGK